MSQPECIDGVQHHPEVVTTLYTLTPLIRMPHIRAHLSTGQFLYCIITSHYFFHLKYNILYTFLRVTTTVDLYYNLRCMKKMADFNKMSIINKFMQLTPDLIDGLVPQSTANDIYSYGALAD